VYRLGGTCADTTVTDYPKQFSRDRWDLLAIP
jgi:hypothetical protein